MSKKRGDVALASASTTTDVAAIETAPLVPTDTAAPAITLRERNTIVRALAGGMVPVMGLEHLVVGREIQTKALVGDIESIKQGSATCRVLIGPVGAGKTFQLHLIGSRAVQENVVVVSSDLSVNNRLHATDGRARALYSGLMANVFTRACPLGNGLRPLLESFISSVALEVGHGASADAVAEKVKDKLQPLMALPAGFDFAQVLAKYYEGYLTGNTDLQDSALRWLRGEYGAKNDARRDLGVRRIIGDDDVFGALKLFAAFCRLAGYNGVLVLVDELSALTHRLNHAVARQANLQVILTILNECFQGAVSGLGFIFAGTPEALDAPERGLFSVPALRSRLQTCAPRGYIDMASPVLHLEPLGQDELRVLLHNVRRVHAQGNEQRYRLPDVGLEQFFERALSALGRGALGNPRDVLRPFVSLLNVLEQDPERDWQHLVNSTFAGSQPDAAEARLANLRLG